MASGGHFGDKYDSSKKTQLVQSLTIIFVLISSLNLCCAKPHNQFPSWGMNEEYEMIVRQKRDQEDSSVYEGATTAEPGKEADVPSKTNDTMTTSKADDDTNTEGGSTESASQSTNEDAEDVPTLTTVITSTGETYIPVTSQQSTTEVQNIDEETTETTTNGRTEAPSEAASTSSDAVEEPVSQLTVEIPVYKKSQDVSSSINNTTSTSGDDIDKPSSQSTAKAHLDEEEQDVPSSTTDAANTGTTDNPAGQSTAEEMKNMLSTADNTISSIKNTTQLINLENNGTAVLEGGVNPVNEKSTDLSAEIAEKSNSMPEEEGEEREAEEEAGGKMETDQMTTTTAGTPLTRATPPTSYDDPMPLDDYSDANEGTNDTDSTSNGEEETLSSDTEVETTTIIPKSENINLYTEKVIDKSTTKATSDTMPSEEPMRRGKNFAVSIKNSNFNTGIFVILSVMICLY